MAWTRSCFGGFLYYDHANVLDQLKAHLLSPALLTERRLLSLKSRLAQIHQRWGVELRSPQTLANWYHRHGLTNKVAPYRVTCRYDDAHKLRLQQEFCLRLLRHWDAGAEIIFVDESTSNAWMRGNQKSWMLPGQPIFLRLAPSSGQSQAIQGAISNKQRQFLWAVSDGNCGEPFQQFVRKIAAWAKDPKNTVLVLDNASYHRSKVVKQIAETKGMGLLFLPASSSKYTSLLVLSPSPVSL